MIEKTIVLEEIDPLEIYGVNNQLFVLLTSHFPKLKAVARGSEIYLAGPQEEIVNFENKIKALVAKRMRKSNLNRYDIESLFEEDGRMLKKVWSTLRRITKAS